MQYPNQQIKRPTSSFVSISDVFASLDKHRQSNTKMLFTTMNSMAGSKPSFINALNQASYIKNSILFDFVTSICDKNNRLSNMMPSVEQFTQQVRALGINQHDNLIVYDDFGNFCASRVWFMFRAMGFVNIKVMDGGLPTWLKASLPTVQTLYQPSEMGDFVARPSDIFKFVDSTYVEQKIDDVNSITIDARSADRFTGSLPDPRPNVRSGHIPLSINIHYSSLQKGIGEADIAQITDVFSDIGPSKEVLFSCGSGVTACILAQSFFEIHPQHNAIRVYDGSWSDWGCNDALPIEYTYGD